MNEREPRSGRDRLSDAQEARSLARENEVRYTSPAEQSPEDLPQHRFEITNGDEVVGGAEIDYFSKPLPLYQLTDLWVDDKYAGQGNASHIMAHVEAFLKTRRKPGLVVDAIIEGSPAQGMYERRGWQPVPGGFGLHVYNWPQDVSLDVLIGHSMRQTPFLEREGQNDTADDEPHL